MLGLHGWLDHEPGLPSLEFFIVSWKSLLAPAELDELLLVFFREGSKDLPEPYDSATLLIQKSRLFVTSILGVSLKEIYVYDCFTTDPCL